jgi:acetoin utilization deacetylase AcuC-like enzyme
MGAAIATLELPSVVLQEGGYAVDALGANAVAFLDGIRGTHGGAVAS